MAHSDEISRTGSESEESDRESRGKDSDGSDEQMSSDDLEDNSVYRGWYDDAVEPANNLGPKSLKSTSKTTWLKIGRERRPMPELSGLSKTIFSTHSEHSWNRSN